MVLFGFANYDRLCATAPQSVCNVFVRQASSSRIGIFLTTQILAREPPSSYPALLNVTDPTVDPAGFASSLARLPLGVRPTCSIPHVGNGHLGNIALIVVAGLSVFVVTGLAVLAARRSAAVARTEMAVFFALYAVTCLLQLLDAGSILDQVRAAARRLG